MSARAHVVQDHSTIPATHGVTADELCEMSFPDEKTELVRGKIIRMSPTGDIHGIVVMEIGRLLSNHVKENHLGVVCADETGFIVARDPDTVRAPDASFVSNERMEGLQQTGKFWPFAPDLAVEVVSPDDTPKKVKDKVRDWFDGGTRLVWVAYPAKRTVHVYHSPQDVRVLQESDVLAVEDVVLGFTCGVADIFA
jgi:Uma2 family endonuclease